MSRHGRRRVLSTSGGLLPLPFLLLLLLTPGVAAHAVLQSADPPPNGRAEEGITVVEFRFTEDVEKQYTNADVVNLQGESQAAGPVEFDPDRHNVIRIPVKPLTSGLYAANWRALSVDTHTTRGSFVFAVGNATLRPGEYAADASDPAIDSAAVARDGFARFAFYAGLFLAGGMPLFALFVLREAPPRGLFATAASFGITGAAGAGVSLLFLAQRTDLGLAVLETAPGRSLALRGALVLAAALAAMVAASHPRRWRVASYAAIGLAGAGALATALGSHAAAAKDLTLVLVGADLAHLAAGAVWMGGIAAFLHVWSGRSALETSQHVFRFTKLAVPSVIILLATGTLASFAHMPCATEGPAACLRAMRTENYIVLVAVKLALMAPLIALGAYNKYRVGPRLAQGAWSPKLFRRIVQAEAILLAIVLGAAGMLAASAPPSRELETGQGYNPIHEQANFTQKSHVILQVSPNPVTVGLQTIVVIVHPLGPTLPNSTQVVLKIWPVDEKEPDLTIDIEKVTPNEWEKEDGFFTAAGDWNVLILLQRPDEFVRIPFVVPVVNPGTGS